jgi:pyruvate/2-oxoglutarate dehydrogenase complex dihydrolipoamide acyltransferase (E2) component
MAERIPIRVPKLGMDTTEAVLVRWLVREGDQISKGIPLMELESEKVTFAYESELDGVLRTIVEPEGNTVSVGAIVCYIEP